jgi:adenylosuccinate synthase
LAEAMCECKHAKKKGHVDVVLGAQWGDEGKGKLVDIISGDYSICARVAGGSNAGHTIVVEVGCYSLLS